jgi:hypothetical protein
MIDAHFWARFVLAVLATWRVTHLLANEDGPADLIVRLRSRLGHGFAGQLMDCFHCLSFWVAAPMAWLVARTPLDLLLAWLALSGAACLLERAGPQPSVGESLSRVMGGEVDDGMLRSEAGGHQELTSLDGNTGFPAARAQ